MSEIESLTGRDLNIKILEEIFGYKHYVGSAVPDEHVHFGANQEEVWLLEPDVNHPFGKRVCRNCGDLPDYSEDIAAAWEVVGKMQEHGYPMILDNNDYRGHFDCGFYTDDVTLIQAEAETAPLAICRAALLVAGRSKEESKS